MGAHHAAGVATTQLSVQAFKGDIISIELQHPIFKVWKTTGTADYLAFTGAHQTLCVLDAASKN